MTTPDRRPDIERLERLESALSSALKRLAQDGGRRSHLKILSASSDVLPGMAWRQWPRTELSVRFETFPSDGLKESRSRLEDQTIFVNTMHSDFVSRLDKGRNVGTRLIGYAAMIVAAHYAQRMENQTSELVNVACRLEDATANQFTKTS